MFENEKRFVNNLSNIEEKKSNNCINGVFNSRNPLSPNNNLFKICFWNGGGKIQTRLKTNPELRNFLTRKPDIFVYGETGPTPQGLSISGYTCYVHKSKLNTCGNYRRGLAIFSLLKYRHSLTKIYSSNNYDIVWFSFDSPLKTLYFCFFYAPGAHHSYAVRSKFYEIFSSQYSRFASLGHVYLLGDTNARLGHLINDRNVHGVYTTNSNKPLFLEFLQYSGLTILNSKFCKGIPTYQIVNKKRSIIDLGLTNAIESVIDFQVEPSPFGVNSQTCHRALTATINFIPPARPPRILAPRRTKLFKLSSEDLERLGVIVSNRLMDINVSTSPDYFTLSKLFTKAKQEFKVGSCSKSRKPYNSPAILKLQRRFTRAIVQMQQDKTDFSYFVVDNLEKLLNAQYEHEKEIRTSNWLQKLNVLDFKNRTRAFFSELRKKYNVSQNTGSIFDSSGILSNNLDTTLKNWTEYYKKLYSCSDPPEDFPTPEIETTLDRDLELSEFLDEIYALKSNKSPGIDGLTSEDFLSLIPKESPNEDLDNKPKLASLKYIFNILEEFWFNEAVPRDFKRTILSPFLKNDCEDNNDPGNYRPISLLNSLMKIYEGMICSRIAHFFEENNVLSPNQAAYRKNRSIFDHIMVLHEVFLEYRYCKLGPRGGASKKPLFFCFLDLRKAFDTVNRNLLFKKLYNTGLTEKSSGSL